jgi:ribonuclease-3
VVADIVYKKFEGKREGFLTNTRSKIVQRETLNRLAIEIGLDKLIKYSARQSSHNSYMCGNAFEALVGAIYLDRGYRACKHFMEHRIIGPYINLEKISRKEVNFKSKLIEWSQKNRVELTFELITQSHDQCFSPTFESEVLIEGIPAGRGIGYSKKESQQRAAHEAMGKIKDSAFMESVLAAKSVREAPQEEVMLPREEAVETVISAVSEEIGISELNEQIISEAEEMAFKEVK